MLATLLQLQINPNEDVIFQLTNTAIFLGLMKFLFVTAAILYVIFSFVVVRQISLMRHTVVTSLSSFLPLIGYVHLFAAILVVIIFFITL